MTRSIRFAAVQVPPRPIGASLDGFADDVREVARQYPGVQLIVYPELHLFGPEADPPEERNAALRAAAGPLDGPLDRPLSRLAAELGVWLVPGSVCELGPNGELFNTAVVYSPAGVRVANYRKVFPWRPFEPYDPGDQFVVFDIPGVGRFGISICYDAWFPELSRHLAWLGAEVIINLVKTTTPDRAQELVLARANSIVNQVFTVSVNCGGPVGVGRSIVVDPEGGVLDEVPDATPTVIRRSIDLDEVTRVRTHGTAGLNRMWDQFGPTDHPIELPLYRGRITPERWHPTTTNAS